MAAFSLRLPNMIDSDANSDLLSQESNALCDSDGAGGGIPVWQAVTDPRTALTGWGSEKGQS